MTTKELEIRRDGKTSSYIKPTFSGRTFVLQYSSGPEISGGSEKEGESEDGSELFHTNE
jgi:hypothetical protein